MDALNDERGQAMAVVAVALAIAVVAIAGLREAQQRLLDTTRSHRAGEAAVEAAAASLADAYIIHLASVGARASQSPRSPDVPALVADQRTQHAARAAANELARANGSGPIESLAASCAGGRVEVRLVLNGYPHHAGFNASECSRR